MLTIVDKKYKKYNENEYVRYKENNENEYVRYLLFSLFLNNHFAIKRKKIMEQNIVSKRHKEITDDIIKYDRYPYSFTLEPRINDNEMNTIYLGMKDYISSYLHGGLEELYEANLSKIFPAYGIGVNIMDIIRDEYIEDKKVPRSEIEFIQKLNSNRDFIKYKKLNQTYEYTEKMYEELIPKKELRDILEKHEENVKKHEKNVEKYNEILSIPKVDKYYKFLRYYGTIIENFLDFSGGGADIRTDWPFSLKYKEEVLRRKLNILINPTLGRGEKNPIFEFYDKLIRS